MNFSRERTDLSSSTAYSTKEANNVQKSFEPGTEAVKLQQRNRRKGLLDRSGFVVFLSLLVSGFLPPLRAGGNNLVINGLVFHTRRRMQGPCIACPSILNGGHNDEVEALESGSDVPCDSGTVGEVEGLRGHVSTPLSPLDKLHLQRLKHERK